MHVCFWSNFFLNVIRLAEKEKRSNRYHWFCERFYLKKNPIEEDEDEDGELREDGDNIEDGEDRDLRGELL